MEVITIDGTTYRKASLLAKQFKYTADYIGQLCRARKVDAKLVGRTWYVNPDSVEAHRDGRYVVPLRLDEKPIDNNLKGKISVEPVFRKSTARALQTASRAAAFNKRITWGAVKYEADDSDLLPAMSRSVESVRINLSDAQQITVSETSKPTSLHAEPLPEVSLKGTLTVESIADDFDSETENIAISEAESFSVPVTISPVSTKATRRDLVRTDVESKVLSRNRLVPRPQSIDPVTFTPRRLQGGDVSSGTIAVKSLKAKDSTNRLAGLLLLAGILLAFVALLLTALLEVSIFVTGTDLQTTFDW